MMKDFELLAHTADLKIRIYGKTKQELFRNALHGMFQSIRPISSSCHYNNDRLFCDSLPKRHAIVIDSIDIESLLVDFLSEALYLSDTNNEAYLDVIIEEFGATHIKAIFLGIAIEGFDGVEIKAVTYHDLKIEFINGVWQVEIVFDI